MVLSGTLPGFQDFATGIGDANQTYYTIVNTADNTWEVGTGTYTLAGTSLSRDTVFASSNANSPVSFAAGTKTIIATVAAQFFGAALTASTHAVLNHSGVLGVPGPETFTAGDHDVVDHTGLPFQLLDEPAHNAIDHTIGQVKNLLDEPTHDALDHTGLNGVNAFDAAAHGLENHAGILGVPAAETFTSPVHTATDHALIPGVFAQATHAVEDHTGIMGVGVTNYAFQISAELGGGAVHALGRIYDFPMGIGTVKFAVCGFATHNDNSVFPDDGALITNTQINFPVAGTVRVTFNTAGPGLYESSLLFSCTAYS